MGLDDGSTTHVPIKPSKDSGYPLIQISYQNGKICCWTNSNLNTMMVMRLLGKVLIDYRGNQ